MVSIIHSAGKYSASFEIRAVGALINDWSIFLAVKSISFYPSKALFKTNTD
jgi:hypothetical protein